MPIGMELPNSHEAKRDGHESKQCRKHAENDMDTRGLGCRHRMGNVPSNENKMSDGGRERESIGVEVWKSFQKWGVTAVRRFAPSHG